MIAIFLMLLAADPAVSGPALPAPGSGQSQSVRDQAQAQALIGSNELHLGRLSEAQANCDAAFKSDPANETAKVCLDLVARMLVDQDLNTADGKLLSGEKAAARTLASKWVYAASRPGQRERARRIVTAASQSSPSDWFKTFTPEWLRQVSGHNRHPQLPRRRLVCVPQALARMATRQVVWHAD